MESMEGDLLWIVVLGFIIAFILALGLGANDVANSFGTSVGSKVISLTGACVIATICETSGALLAGEKVTDAIRGNIVAVNLHHNGTSEREVLIGYLSALGGGATWLVAATALKLPVSSTHSTVGAMIGFGLVAFGKDAISWREVGKIALSWVISPLLAGTLSCVFYISLQHTILNKPDSYKTALKALPFLYFIILSVNLFAVIYNGSAVLHFDDIPLYGCVILSFGTALLFALLTQFLLVPYLQKTIDKEFQSDECDGETGLGDEDPLKGSDTDSELVQSNSTNGGDSKENLNLLIERKHNLAVMDVTEDNQENAEVAKVSSDILVDEPKTARLLAFVQILTASFASFAHGSNDVSNAIGPLVSLWLSFKHGKIDTGLHTPPWILLYGGIGISLGLWIWGRRVIETIGEELSTITPSSGFIIEFGTVFTVLLASNLGVPVSTTHCLVGAVTLVGLLRSRSVTDWKVFRNIVFAWLVTVPVTGCLAALIFAILRCTV